MKNNILTLELRKELRAFGRQHRADHPVPCVRGGKADFAFQLRVEQIVKVFRGRLFRNNIGVIGKSDIRFAIGRPINQPFVRLFFDFVRV